VTGAEVEAAITSKTKAILIGYPNNPTGAVMSRERLDEIAAVAAKHDLFVISDEIYERLVYQSEHTHFATLKDMRPRTLVLSGFSKSHAMTGWRLGFAVGPKDVIAAMRKIHQYTIMSAPSLAQYAITDTMAQVEDQVIAMREEYDRRRKLIVSGFNELGLPCFDPGGAFYAFPNITASGMDDEVFAETLLAEEQVAMIPGRVFGESGRGFVRASYATAYEQIEEALERVRRFMNRHG
jgi:aminotransferase